MRVEVDTRDRSGAVAMDKAADRPSYRTEVFGQELEQADQMVQRIIAANLGGQPGVRVN